MDIYAFMRDRKIEDHILKKMREDKIDAEVVSLMDDRNLARYIPSYGDRIAIQHFVKHNKNNKRKVGVLDRLRAKLKLKKTSLSSDDSETDTSGTLFPKLEVPLNAKKSSRQIEIGWMHKGSKGLKQVRAKRGGGTRKLQIEKRATKQDIKNLATEKFFPKEVSPLGPKSDFEFEILDFKQNVLDDGLDVGGMYELTGLPVLRFYLLSEATRQEPDCESETASLPSLSEEDILYSDLKDTSDCSIHNLNNDSVVSSSASKYTVNGVNLEVSSNIKPSAPASLETVANPSSSFNPLTPNIDFTADMETPPEIPDYIDDGDILKAATWISGITEADSEVQFGKFPDQQTLDDTLPMISNPYKLTSCSSQTIRVHRGQALSDMITFFENPEIDPYSTDVVVEMVLPGGKTEKAEDNGGVLRDSLTEFWDTFYETCCNGCQFKVPFLRHDYEKTRWVAIAKVLVTGKRQEGYFPLRISKPFIEQCVFEKHSSDIVTAFMNIVPETDKEIMMQALEDFESIDYDELLDVLEHWECRTRPSKYNIKTIIRQMAEKAILHEPNLVTVLWAEILNDLKLSQTELDKMYIDLRPTPRGVLKKIIWPESMNANESTVAKYLQQFIKEIDLSKFLRFVTGADLMVSEQIFVRFVELQGLMRRPVAHTCGCVLELANTYENYAAFKSEFKSVLESNVWVMDII